MEFPGAVGSTRKPLRPVGWFGRLISVHTVPAAEVTGGPVSDRLAGNQTLALRRVLLTEPIVSAPRVLSEALVSVVRGSRVCCTCRGSHVCCTCRGSRVCCQRLSCFVRGFHVCCQSQRLWCLVRGSRVCCQRLSSVFRGSPVCCQMPSCLSLEAAQRLSRLSSEALVSCQRLSRLVRCSCLRSEALMSLVRGSRVCGYYGLVILLA